VGETKEEKGREELGKKGGYWIDRSIPSTAGRDHGERKRDNNTGTQHRAYLGLQSLSTIKVTRDRWTGGLTLGLNGSMNITSADYVRDAKRFRRGRKGLESTRHKMRVDQCEFVLEK